MIEKLLPHRQRRPCKNRPVRILAGYVVCELPQQPQPGKRGYQQYYPHRRRLTLSQRVARLVLCRYDDQNDHKRDPQPSAPGFSMRHTWISRHVGRRLLKENLQEGRAAYGKRILVTLSQELKAEFGDGFSYSALTRMVRFEESFVDEAIGFKGRFVRKKDFQYAHIAMPLNSLDRARTIPDDADGLRASRNPMVEQASS